MSWTHNSKVTGWNSGEIFFNRIVTVSFSGCGIFWTVLRFNGLPLSSWHRDKIRLATILLLHSKGL